MLVVYSVTSREIKNHFIAHLIDQGKSDNTVNGRIKGIKQFFRYLFEEGWKTANIADELHVVKAEKLMIQTFTREQVADLLAQPDRKTFFRGLFLCKSRQVLGYLYVEAC